MGHLTFDLEPRASFEPLIHRILDAREEERPALIGELRLPNGRLTPVVQQFRDAYPDLFFSLVPELGYVLPSKAIHDLNEALTKVSVLPNFDEIRKRVELVGNGSAFKSRDSALYEIDRVYKELPALIGETWHDSDLRKVLGKSLSDLTMPEEDAPQTAPSSDTKGAEPSRGVDVKRPVPFRSIPSATMPVFPSVPVVRPIQPRPAQRRPIAPPPTPIGQKERRRHPHLIDDGFAKLVRNANKAIVDALSRR